MRQLLLIACLLAAAVPSWAAEHGRLAFGDVVEGPAIVLDGNTYEMGGEQWRELGINAPKMHGDPRGVVARAALDDLVAARPIRCTFYERDNHGQPVGRCMSSGGRSLALEMLRGGWAWVYRTYVPDDLAGTYDATEKEARDASRGFWVKSGAVERDWLGVLQGLTPLIAVVLVALTALFAWLIRRWEHKQERLSLAAAIASEISATIAIIDRRGHVELAKRLIQLLKEGQNSEMPRFADPDVMPQDMIKSYPVFHANVGKIGILGPQAAAEIAIFYTQTIGIAGTLRNWSRGGLDAAAPNVKAAAIIEELAQWEEARNIGLRICAETLNPRRK